MTIEEYKALPEHIKHTIRIRSHNLFLTMMETGICNMSLLKCRGRIPIHTHLRENYIEINLN